MSRSVLFRKEQKTQVPTRNCSAPGLLDVALQLNYYAKEKIVPCTGIATVWSLLCLRADPAQVACLKVTLVLCRKQILAYMNLSALKNDAPLRKCNYAI